MSKQKNIGRDDGDGAEEYLRRRLSNNRRVARTIPLISPLLPLRWNSLQDIAVAKAVRLLQHGFNPASGVNMDLTDVSSVLISTSRVWCSARNNEAQAFGYTLNHAEFNSGTRSQIS
jgi:hypothetical protein